MTPEGESVSDTITAGYGSGTLDDNGLFFEETSVAKSGSLALLVSGMKEAAEIYGTAPDEAITILQDVLNRSART